MPEHVSRLSPASGRACAGRACARRRSLRSRAARPALRVDDAALLAELSEGDRGRRRRRSRVRLFPGQFADLHEIQGGEQKTHELFVCVRPRTASRRCRSTGAGRRPSRARRSGVVPRVRRGAVPGAARPGARGARQRGDRRARPFELKREVDRRVRLAALRRDLRRPRSRVRHKGATPLVSHYNNQYDPIAGFAYQFLRTGDPRWWTMMDELAAHVIDIDIYHTDAGQVGLQPRPVLAHVPLRRRGHGDAPDLSARRRRAGRTAAGRRPSTTTRPGLMLHYFLTGDEASRADGRSSSAQYVIDMDDGRTDGLPLAGSRATPGTRSAVRPGYYGPGRGAGELARTRCSTAIA